MKTITDRIDNIAFIKDEYRHKVLPAPESVKIELSRMCNFKCSFCTNSALTGKKEHMDQHLFEALATEMRVEGVKELGMFYFGESFLVPWLPEAIQFAKDIGYEYVFLTTNGSVTTPTKVKACMEAGLDSLKFSFNYADEEQFVEIARVRSTFYQKIKDHIKAAYEIREKGNFDCGLFASYIKYDGEQGDRMKAAVNEMTPYLDEIYALPLYNQAAYITHDEWEFSAGNRGRADNMAPPLPCWAVFQEGHINFDGTMNACCFAVSEDFHMGDLKEHSFMDVWNGQKFQDLREAHLNMDLTGTPCQWCMSSEEGNNE